MEKLGLPIREFVYFDRERVDRIDPRRPCRGDTPVAADDDRRSSPRFPEK